MGSVYEVFVCKDKMDMPTDDRVSSTASFWKCVGRGQ